jgi:hypothetical protein
VSDIFSYWSKHFSNSTKVLWLINTEHQVNICIFLSLNFFIIKVN